MIGGILIFISVIGLLIPIRNLVTLFKKEEYKYTDYKVDDPERKGNE